MGSTSVLFWLPRLLGVAAAAFLSLFALDVAGESAPITGATVLSVAMHLIPAMVVVAALAVAWRNELAGGLLFIALGLAYAVSAGGRLDWVAVVAGPLWLIGALFLVARSARRGPART